MKKGFIMVLIVVAVLILILVSIIITRTFTYPFKKLPGTNIATTIRDTSNLAMQRLAGGLKIPTVSHEDEADLNPEPFDRMVKYLRDAYPAVYQNLDTFTVNRYGLVFRWKGSDRGLAPILFIAHYDVVPPGDAYDNNLTGHETTESVSRPGDAALPPSNTVAENWEFPPFSGAVANGRIYGRGALDMKGPLFALLEAADQLVNEGFQPSRDIYFAFGHDEEIGGEAGAVKIAGDFRRQHLMLDAIYDEGGIILAPEEGGLVNRDIALVGLAEKGFLTLKISVKGLGGHSSMPPEHSALGRAAILIQRLEDNQMPAMLTGPIREMLDNIGPAMGFLNRMGIANQWLFKPVLIRSLSSTPSSNALIRTTTAITMARGSDASNVLPPVAEFVVNFRILPGNSVADVMDHVQRLCRGFEVETTIVNRSEPSRVSSTDSHGYRVLEEALSKIYPEAIVSPYISVIASDSRNYSDLTENIFRIIPVRLTVAEQRSIHNRNEYISIDNYRRMISCYAEIIKNY